MVEHFFISRAFKLSENIKLLQQEVVQYQVNWDYDIAHYPEIGCMELRNSNQVQEYDWRSNNLVCGEDLLVSICSCNNCYHREHNIVV